MNQAGSENKCSTSKRVSNEYILNNYNFDDVSTDQNSKCENCKQRGCPLCGKHSCRVGTVNNTEHVVEVAEVSQQQQQTGSNNSCHHSLLQKAWVYLQSVITTPMSGCPHCNPKPPPSSSIESPDQSSIFSKSLSSQQSCLSCMTSCHGGRSPCQRPSCPRSSSSSSCLNARPYCPRDFSPCPSPTPPCANVKPPSPKAKQTHPKPNAKTTCPHAKPPCLNAECPNLICPNAEPSCPNAIPPCPYAKPPCPNAKCPNPKPSCPSLQPPCPQAKPTSTKDKPPCTYAKPPPPDDKATCPHAKPPYLNAECPNIICPNAEPSCPNAIPPCPYAKPNYPNAKCPNAKPSCPSLQPPCPQAKPTSTKDKPPCTYAKPAPPDDKTTCPHAKPPSLKAECPNLICPNAEPSCPNAIPFCPYAKPPCPNAKCPNAKSSCPSLQPPCPQAKPTSTKNKPSCTYAKPPPPDDKATCPHAKPPCLNAEYPNLICPNAEPSCINAIPPCPYAKPPHPNAKCPNAKPSYPSLQAPCAHAKPTSTKDKPPCPYAKPPPPDDKPTCPHAKAPCLNAECPNLICPNAKCPNAKPKAKQSKINLQPPCVKLPCPNSKTSLYHSFSDESLPSICREALVELAKIHLEKMTSDHKITCPLCSKRHTCANSQETIASYMRSLFDQVWSYFNKSTEQNTICQPQCALSNCSNTSIRTRISESSIPAKSRCSCTTVPKPDSCPTCLKPCIKPVTCPKIYKCEGTTLPTQRFEEEGTHEHKSCCTPSCIHNSLGVQSSYTMSDKSCWSSQTSVNPLYIGSRQITTPRSVEELKASITGVTCLDNSSGNMLGCEVMDFRTTIKYSKPCVQDIKVSKDSICSTDIPPPKLGSSLTKDQEDHKFGSHPMDCKHLKESLDNCEETMSPCNDLVEHTCKEEAPCPSSGGTAKSNEALLDKDLGSKPREQVHSKENICNSGRNSVTCVDCNHPDRKDCNAPEIDAYRKDPYNYRYYY